MESIHAGQDADGETQKVKRERGQRDEKRKMRRTYIGNY